jgi:hypothetical protein
MNAQELQKVVAIHTTAKSIHFLNKEGNPVFKMRVGDSLYIDEDSNIYTNPVVVNAGQYVQERRFFLNEPVAIDAIDPEEYRKIDEHKHLSLVSTNCRCFTDPYNWYSAFCSKLCFD